MYRLPGNSEVVVGQQFAIGPTTYPQNWLGLATPADLSEVGITYTPDPVVLDPAPAAPTLTDVKAVQVQAIVKACEAQLSQITSPYPPSEIASWDSQYLEASAWTADNSAQTPLLNAIIAQNGQTLAAQAASVLSKASAFKAASGAAIGRRQLLTDQINAITDTTAIGIAAVQAIVW